jgi:hypothetical protein
VSPYRAPSFSTLCGDALRFESPARRFESCGLPGEILPARHGAYSNRDACEESAAAVLFGDVSRAPKGIDAKVNNVLRFNVLVRYPERAKSVPASGPAAEFGIADTGKELACGLVCVPEKRRKVFYERSG